MKVGNKVEPELIETTSAFNAGRSSVRISDNRKEITMDTKQIAFEVTLEGVGVVQFDQSSQQYYYKDAERTAKLEQLGNDNINFAKANYYNNPEYDPTNPNSRAKKFLRKIKISGAGLRHATHEATMPFHTPQFFQNPAIRTEILSSMDYILRGYMYAPSKGAGDAETIRRASSYIITDAEECGDAVSSIEVHTTTGERNNTSLFYLESIGESKYVAKGFINLDQLQFISASSNADRMALNAEDLLTVIPAMKEKYGEDSVKLGYYHLVGATKPLAEKGLILSDEFVSKMVNYLFELISNLKITRKSAYAKTSKIRVKLINDQIGRAHV